MLLPAAGCVVVGGAVLGEGVVAWEFEELEELLLEEAGGELVGAGVLVEVVFSGSTYCWSPADVEVPPWATAAPGASSARAATAKPAMILVRQPTRPIEATTVAGPALQ